MSEKVTIELPDELSRRARRLAAAGHRRLEDAVVDWINRAVSDPDVEALADDELLRICDATFEASEQAELSGLLADAREGSLDTARHARLDELMSDYRRGLVLKARAWKEAVTRGLRPPPAGTEAGADHAA
jgi:predicted transcriptional regulator